MPYSDEDKEAFARKDRMIVAQTSLERAIQTFSLGDSVGMNIATQDILNLADRYYDYVFEKADNVVREDSGDTGDNQPESADDLIPVPTDSQKKWLEIIQQNFGYTQLQVWEKFKKYPKDKKEATQMVTQLKKGQ